MRAITSSSRTISRAASLSIWSAGPLALCLAFALTLGCGSKRNELTGDQDAAVPAQRDQATVEQGAQSVKTRKCESCHLANMAGQLTMLPYPSDPRVELYPPNLTPDQDTGIGKWTDEQLAAAIRTGVDQTGLELCPQMQHFSTMNDYETYSIIKYLRSLPPVHQKVLRSVCPPLKTKDEQDAGI